MKINFLLKVFVFAIFLSFFGCNNTSELIFEEYRYDKTIGDCDNGICLDIHLKYYVLHEPIKVAENFNTEMEALIYGKMVWDDEESKIDVDRIIQARVDDYEAEVKEFPNARSGGFELNTTSSISFKSNSLVSFNILTDAYSGGAHGMDWDEYLNIDLSNGKKINIPDLMKDKIAFSNYVEKEMRAYLEMTDTDDWGEFTLVDEFALPENMGMTEAGLRLVYNPYEMLAYAAGQTEIIIPNEKLKEFMDLP